MNIRSTLLISLLNCILLLGCALSTKVYEHDIQADTYISDFLRSESVLLIADNQESLEYRQGNFETSKIIRKYGLRSANRPRALTKWTRTIINVILQKEKETKLILHLGDVLNNSCKVEWEKVVSYFRTTGRFWFIVPGNHDGYYFGITSPTQDSKIATFGALNEYYGGWGGACVPLYLRNGQADADLQEEHIYNKSDYVKGYIDELEYRGLDIRNSKIEKVNGNQKYHCSVVKDKYLSEICWAIDEKEPWRSFVMQNITIHKDNSDESSAVLLAIDTSSFPWQPKSLSKSAFNPVELTLPVIDITKRWLESSTGKPVIIAGHHPFEKFVGKGRQAMLNWWDNGFYIGYISGDTHDGMVTKYQSPNCGNTEKCGLLEINIGSLLDAPIEYRTLKVITDNKGINRINAKRVFLTPPHNTDREGYKRQPENADKSFAACESFVLKNKICLFNKSESNELKDFVFKKGASTSIEKLMDEAYLYRQIIRLTQTENHWKNERLSSAIAAPCRNHLGSSIDESLNFLTMENAEQCWPNNQDDAAYMLIKMSKVLEEIGREIDAFYNQPGYQEFYSNYKYCTAVLSSDAELCQMKNYWNSNSFTSTQYFLDGSCNE